MELKDLKTIKLNEVEYVTKKEVEKILSVKKKRSLDPLYLLPDPCHVIAIGSCAVEDGYNLLRLDIDLLTRGIKILKQLDNVDDLVFCFKQDYPLIMGRFDKTGKIVAGVVIAPRVEDEKE